MRKAITTVLSIVTFFSPVLTARATGVGDLDLARSWSLVVVDRLRQVISSRGSPNVQAMDKPIRFEVTDSLVPTAFASFDEVTGKPKIQLSNQLALLIMYLTESNILAGERGQKDCDLIYTQYISQALGDVHAAVRNGVAIPRILAPEEFGSRNGGPCLATAKLYPFPEDLKARRYFLTE